MPHVVRVEVAYYLEVDGADDYTEAESMAWDVVQCDVDRSGFRTKVLGASEITAADIPSDA